MKRTSTFASIILLLTVLPGCGGSGGGGATIFADIFTSFEPSDFTLGSTTFTLGTAPDSVDFTGGMTATIGQGHLYKSGIASWRVTGASAVMVADLDKDAAIVVLYAANEAGGQGEIRVYDETDTLKFTVTITVTSMMVPGAKFVFIATDLGATGISKIEVTNGPGAGDVTWIDDFGVTYP